MTNYTLVIEEKKINLKKLRLKASHSNDFVVTHPHSEEEFNMHHSYRSNYDSG
jgi:hypothetical protein